MPAVTAVGATPALRRATEHVVGGANLALHHDGEAELTTTRVGPHVVDRVALS